MVYKEYGIALDYLFTSTSRAVRDEIYRGRDLTAPQDESVNREMILRNDERAAKNLFNLGRTGLFGPSSSGPTAPAPNRSPSSKMRVH